MRQFSMLLSTVGAYHRTEKESFGDDRIYESVFCEFSYFNFSSLKTNLNKQRKELVSDVLEDVCFQTYSHLLAKLMLMQKHSSMQ